MREMYSHCAQKFEDQILTVGLNVGEDDLSISERHAKSYLAIDDRLEYAPIQTIMNRFSKDLFIEWTYTIDLDREVFAVDDAACFKLSNIPPGGQWIRHLTEDVRQRRKLHDNTPKDIIADISWKPNIDLDPSLKALGQAFNVEVLSLTDFAAETIKQMMPARINFLITAFLQMCRAYRKVLDRFILGWEPSCFMFREMAFAVLSLAAGEVFFEYPEVLDRKYEANGYYLLPNSSKNHTRMLPRFLHESHLPGIEPGSAPKSTSFWFHNVLVHLNSRLDLNDVEEASVVAVVNDGLGQGYEEFYAMVLSILDVVLIRVQKGHGGKPYIRRSPLMALFEFTDENSGYVNGPRTRPSPPQQSLNKPDSHDTKQEDRSLEEDDDTSEEDGVASNESADPAAAGYFAFMLMYHFFNAAAAEKLAGTRSLLFPNEILSLIMDFSDMRTYLALAQASAFCHEISQHKLRLNDDYAVIGSGEDPETFVLEDLHSGKKIHSKLSMYREWLGRAIADGLKLSPVIGVTDTDRLSIMDDVAIQLSDVTPKDPIMPETEEVSLR